MVLISKLEHSELILCTLARRKIGRKYYFILIAKQNGKKQKGLSSFMQLFFWVWQAS
jgi:hypothetical protein